MKNIILLLLLIPNLVLGEEVTTGNLIDNNFGGNWSPQSTNSLSNHNGNNIIAGYDDKFVQHDSVSLSDDANMTEAQIQNGWTSEFATKIWHWNTSTSTTKMTQTITDNLGNVSTQIRNVTKTSCGYTNCGSFGTYNGALSKHTQNSNSATDYDIVVRVDFDESTSSSGHWGPDLKNPTLKITYESNPVSLTTVQEIEEAAEDIEEAIEAFENQEIGSTTFQEMVENIIVDTGLDMTLAFEEPEMDMEEYLVMEDDLEVGTVEQLIEDEMAGVSFVPIEEFEETPNVDMEVEMEEPTFEVENMPTTFTMETNMDMEEPSFTEMAEDTFTSAMDTLTDMFNMDMPEDMSEEVATEVLDAMVEMDLPMDMPMDMPETTSDMDTEMDTSVDMEMEITEDMPDMEEAPVETVAMNNETEMEPEMEPEMEAPTPEPAPEESTPTAEVEEEAPTPTGGAAAESTEEAPIEEEAPTPTEEAPTPTEEPTETESEPKPTEEAPATSEETPTETEDSQAVESDEETTVAETDTDTETSDTTVSTEVQTIGEKIEKIIAKVNAKLKKVSDRVMAVQIVTLKGMQMDGPKLTSYQNRNFYKDRQMYGGNPNFFQDINTLAQQPIYANVALTAYQNNDPLNKQRLIQHEINYEKNKIMLELRELRGQ